MKIDAFTARHCERIAIVNGRRSIGSATLKSAPEKRIYAFRQWGKLYWSGDLENLRPTKREAYQDAGLQFEPPPTE